ncbi:MAG: lysozyme [Leptolyngbyaceae cyanobacterium SM2_5_2]|nr:lysozyme [Leptolyngbyaceae cyanobacterium SM2_5_2]
MANQNPSPCPRRRPVAPPPPRTGSGRINPKGLHIVKVFEGLSTRAYPDPGTGGEPWTIGYGHTTAAGPPRVYPGLTITAAQAEEILKRDLNVFERAVANAVTRPPTSDQFAAMVSFTFNVGSGNFRSSTLLKKHNAGDFARAANEFQKWVYANGKVLQGLVRRRKAERALYLSQNYQQFL